ncbi:MAG: hypothetical protein COB20_01360 [SAR86 cluster bacterium]|uniref:Cyclic di-GMP receptor atypical PilZ domain-containing protein n=1 Tax=SAR86 cluster bacterium TaxID=2030880 RepID=A0A2A4XG68_9GAMM|nr:MAG: hypothetical protein COB20_01360 [SAR86 cluster bacterium]
MEGSYSFTVEKIQHVPTSTELLSIDKENEKLLRTSTIWQDPVEIEELDHDHVSLELRRQDLKISLLLDLVGELMIRQSELPPLESIQLTATGIEFSNEVCTFGAGDMAKATLFLLPALPRALQFYGDITSSERKGFSVLSFQGISIAVQDQIEKIIFTHHRRSIAQEHAGTREI